MVAHPRHTKNRLYRVGQCNNDSINPSLVHHPLESASLANLTRGSLWTTKDAKDREKDERGCPSMPFRVFRVLFMTFAVQPSQLVAMLSTGVLPFAAACSAPVCLLTRS